MRAEALERALRSALPHQRRRRAVLASAALHGGALALFVGLSVIQFRGYGQGTSVMVTLIDAESYAAAIANTPPVQATPPQREIQSSALPPLPPVSRSVLGDFAASEPPPPTKPEPKRQDLADAVAPPPPAAVASPSVRAKPAIQAAQPSVTMPPSVTPATPITTPAPLNPNPLPLTRGDPAPARPVLTQQVPDKPAAKAAPMVPTPPVSWPVAPMQTILPLPKEPVQPGVKVAAVTPKLPASVGETAALPLAGLGADPDLGNDYPDAVRRRLDQYRQSLTRLQGWRGAGDVLVSFVVNGSGEIADATIARSSGIERLDLATLDLLRLASPVPPPPDKFRRTGLTMTTIVRFVVDD